MVIETERLRLRHPSKQDVPLLISSLSNWDIAQWLLAPPFPYTEKDAENFLKWANTSHEAGFNGKFTVASIETDELWGIVTIVPDNDRAELGYWLRPDQQKKGVMTEAIAAVLDHAKQKLPGVVCFATVDPENKSSTKCLTTNGFELVRRYQRDQPRRRGSVDTDLYELVL